MQTSFTADTPALSHARDILQKCVHCGFCLATCPSYQVEGNELDSPRGRIYLIREVLQQGQAGTITRDHLDTCLMCRACETTCPSSVEYSALLTLGRERVAELLPRPWPQRLLRRVLAGFASRRWFALCWRLGQVFKVLLPSRLALQLQTVPPPWQGERVAESVAIGSAATAERLILFQGCVQPVMRPAIGQASRALLQAAGYAVVEVAGEGCCGALPEHLEQAADPYRQRNLALWQEEDGEGGGVAGIAFNATACCQAVRDYDSSNPQQAALVANSHDLSFWLLQRLDTLKERLATERLAGRVVFHPPCTSQHGQQADGMAAAIVRLLRSLGAEVVLPADSKICCGAAGTYSLLQPRIAEALGQSKRAALAAAAGAQDRSVGGDKAGAVYLSANIGCLHHLHAVEGVALWHWAEWLAAALKDGLHNLCEPRLRKLGPISNAGSAATGVMQTIPSPSSLPAQTR